MTCFAQMPEFLQTLLQRWGGEILTFVLTSVVALVFGGWLGRRQLRRQWAKKRAAGRVNVSLNILSEGKLKIRTVFEGWLDEILDPDEIDMIQAKSKLTTHDAPLLPLSRKDSWNLLNFVLNAVSEHFSVGMIRHDVGSASVKPWKYRLCLTCEVVGPGDLVPGAEDIRKVRAILVREDWLDHFPFKDQMPELESPKHITRLRTLRQLADDFARSRDPHARDEKFIQMELYV